MTGRGTEEPENEKKTGQVATLTGRPRKNWMCDNANHKFVNIKLLCDCVFCYLLEGWEVGAGKLTGDVL